MKIKFKIGDRVGVIYSEEHSEYNNAYIGQFGTIDENDDCPFVKLDGENRRRCFHQDEYEYEYIINSPLYKALS